MAKVKGADSSVELVVGEVYHVYSATGDHEVTYMGKTFTGKHTFQHSSGEYAFVGTHMVAKRVRKRGRVK